MPDRHAAKRGWIRVNGKFGALWLDGCCKQYRRCPRNGEGIVVPKPETGLSSIFLDEAEGFLQRSRHFPSGVIVLCLLFATLPRQLPWLRRHWDKTMENNTAQSRYCRLGIRINIAVLLATIGISMAHAESHRSDKSLEEMTVFGRATDLVGIAGSASEGSVGGADLLVRPMLKVAELLEAMPGMVAVQHSGSGKANQYFLRGFNLDHGTDYTVSVDAVPWNLRSHGHGQGYLDVNGLIPETVKQVNYRKGPYYAALGDFSLAGSSSIETIDRLEHSFISTELGEYGWARLAAGHSLSVGAGELSVIGESKTYDGPWEQEEGLEHVSLWSKYLIDTRFGQAEFTLSVYDAKWQPTEQIPERAIGSAVCEDEYCALDDSAKGQTSRWILGSKLHGDDWQAGFYAQYYDWKMESNPTYDFQIQQFDKRQTLGGYANKMIVEGHHIKLTVGGDFRYDDISPVGLNQHNKGQFVAEISSNDIKESAIGSYVDLAWHANEQLRVLVGLRGDYYYFDATANNAGAFDGEESDSQISPKLGLAYAANEWLEWYGNWGKGFHSNDARGVVNKADTVPGLSEGTGHEFGGRANIGDVQLTASYWWLDQDSELIFVGDSNSVEPKGGSERDGYELTLFWQPFDGVGIDAVYAHSDARYNNNAEGKYVENAIEEAAQLGISVTRAAWEVSARLRYLGAYALTADNGHRSKPLTTVNIRGAYHWQKITLYAEMINLLDNDGKDISYYYPAYVEGLDAGSSSDDVDCAAVDCTMSRATEPRTLRVGMRYNF